MPDNLSDRDPDNRPSDNFEEDGDEALDETHDQSEDAESEAGGAGGDNGAGIPVVAIGGDGDSNGPAAVFMDGPSGLGAGWNPERARSESAMWVAKALVRIFGGTLAALFLITFMVFVASGDFNDPAIRTELAADYRDTFIAMLEAVATFATTVFGPLLAFILGYYFATEKGGGDPQAAESS